MDVQEETLIARAIGLATALASRPPEERMVIMRRSLAALEKMPDSPAKEDARRFLEIVFAMMEEVR